MNCSEAKRLFSPMLDSTLESWEERTLNAHMGECASCANQYAALRRTKWMMATMSAHQAPPEMALRLKVAISQELAQGRSSRWDGVLVWWENALNAVMLPATVGLLSAVLIFGMLIGVLVPAHLSIPNDVPTKLYTPPEMTSAPFGLSSGTGNGDAILVEVVIDSHGRVQDYRVLNSSGDGELSPEMKNALIFTQFRPATSFGLPTSGRVVISFSNINVGG
jgi:TonB family protein